VSVLSRPPKPHPPPLEDEADPAGSGSGSGSCSGGGEAGSGSGSARMDLKKSMAAWIGSETLVVGLAAGTGLGRGTGRTAGRGGLFALASLSFGFRLACTDGFVSRDCRLNWNRNGRVHVFLPSLFQFSSRLAFLSKLPLQYYTLQLSCATACLDINLN
jgi:hypothetical protein